jgi:LysM repeat protein
MTPEGRAETAAEPTLQATPEPTPAPTPELQPTYFLYTVQPGDTVSSIAGAFHISPDYVLWNNPDVIKEPNLLLVGEELLIPSVDGIIYHAKPGDTLSDIAAFYQIDVQRIVSFPPNGLTSPNNNIAGMILVLPGAVPPPPVDALEPAVPQPQATETPQPTDTPQATETPQPTDTPQATETPQPTDTPPATETPQPTDTPQATETPHAKPSP